MNASKPLEYVFYEAPIPSEIENALVDLYHSAYCVKEYFELYKSYDALNALVIYKDPSKPEHILLFSIAGKEVSLLNEVIEIEPGYLEYFADFIFNKYPCVHTINVDRITCRSTEFSLPFRIWSKSEDTVIQLPDTFAEYHSMLGRHTKSNLSNYSNRLRRIYKDFRFDSFAADQLNPLMVGRIIEMNRARMSDKNIISGFDAELEDKIVKFSRKYGFICTISMNGGIVAGTICYDVGDHCYLQAISHDPVHDKDRVGQVCLYLSIKQSIERGLKAFHFLWGEYEYKYRFLGTKQDLFNISIYRSRRYKIATLYKLLNHELIGFIIKLKYWTNKYILNRPR